ncbi:hypothetical protein JXA02_04665 [candidate division KSB1 bacterium]|nr:hypothetical protein [candidate division KSB1 bacterium]RQW08794.1 MAG: hypothetical protein EH222_05285 [candidate division KSB1 bacterium]
MNLLFKLAQSFQLFRIKLSGRYKKQNLPFDVSQRLRQARRLLICLPAESSEAASACQLVPKLKSNWGKCEITVMQEKRDEFPFVDLADINVMTYSRSDLSRFNMPKKSLLQKLAHGSFDLAIDMSVPLHFTNVIITWMCGADVRVGFYHPDREAFYNFILRQRADDSLQGAYESILNYLLSFK